MDEWQDLASCYARLTALRSNLASNHDIGPEYIREYELILNQLTTLGYNVAAFRVPPDSAQPKVVAFRPATVRSRSRTQYSEARYVPGTLFRIKIDGLLALFTLMNERPSIGFNGPRA